MGAGWNVPEHQAFGIPFPPTGERLDRLEEALRVVRALWDDGPATFAGDYYQLNEVQCYPKPAQSRLPLMVGGNGERRTLRIVAEQADEWNSVGLGLDSYRLKVAVLERHCEAVGRDPATVRRSQMAGFVVGRDQAELHRHLERVVATMTTLRGGPERLLPALRERGWLVGTPAELVDQIGERADAGVSRLMLQHLAIEDDEPLELIASEVLPQL